MKRKIEILPKSFYLRQDPCQIARDLLGKIILSTIDNEKIICRIVETEAYQGPEDRASHSFGNRRSPKNEAMYAEGGLTYIYISYGMHHMLNVVTGSKNQGHAVLIRAVEPIEGIEAIQQNRGMQSTGSTLTGGPGKICQALKITKSHTLLPLYDYRSMITIGDDDYQCTPIVSTPRVGMSKHVKEAANWPYRFYLSENRYVSKPLKVWYDW